MQTLYIVLALLAMAVALFALQNADQVTVTFLAWKLQSPLAAVILGSVAAGGIIAILLNLPLTVLQVEGPPIPDGDRALFLTLARQRVMQLDSLPESGLVRSVREPEPGDGG